MFPTLRIVYAKSIDIRQSALVIQYNDIYIAGIAIVHGISLSFHKHLVKTEWNTDFLNTGIQINWVRYKLINESDIEDFFNNQRWNEGLKEISSTPKLIESK